MSQYACWGPWLARRAEFEKRVAQDNVRQEDRIRARPGGRRHAAQRDYLLHMDAESRGDRSHDQAVVRHRRLSISEGQILSNQDFTIATSTDMGRGLKTGCPNHGHTWRRLS